MFSAAFIQHAHTSNRNKTREAAQKMLESRKPAGGLTTVQARFMAFITDEWRECRWIANQLDDYDPRGAPKILRRMERDGLIECQVRTRPRGRNGLKGKILYVRLPRAGV